MFTKINYLNIVKKWPNYPKIDENQDLPENSEMRIKLNIKISI